MREAMDGMKANDDGIQKLLELEVAYISVRLKLNPVNIRDFSYFSRVSNPRRFVVHARVIFVSYHLLQRFRLPLKRTECSKAEAVQLQFKFLTRAASFVTILFAPSPHFSRIKFSKKS